MDMNVCLAELVGADAELLRARAHVSQGRVGGLLHDIAQMPGERERALAPHRRGFDVENIAARLGPGQAGPQADLVLLPLLLGQEHEFKRLFAPIVEIEGKMELPRWDASTAGLTVEDVGILARSP